MAELFIIATPIGNLEDISSRAKKLLADVDVIAAEDTRQTGKLLKLLGITYKEMIAYHDHNEASQSQSLVERMLADDINVGLVSDAGTPCVSDPGYRLVRAAHEAGIKVHPIPGASALVSLVSASGLASNRFMFEGFLPTKQQQLDNLLTKWQSYDASIVFYESARRIEKTLKAIAAKYPDARIAIGRELTKMYEEVLQMSVEDSLQWAANHTALKGELVVMLELGSSKLSWTEEDLREMARAKLGEGKKHKQVLQEILVLLEGRGPNKSDLYQLILAEKSRLAETAELADES